MRKTKTPKLSISENLERHVYPFIPETTPEQWVRIAYDTYLSGPFGHAKGTEKNSQHGTVFELMWIKWLNEKGDVPLSCIVHKAKIDEEHDLELDVVRTRPLRDGRACGYSLKTSGRERSLPQFDRTLDNVQRLHHKHKLLLGSEEPLLYAVTYREGKHTSPEKAIAAMARMKSKMYCRGAICLSIYDDEAMKKVLEDAA